MSSIQKMTQPNNNQNTSNELSYEQCMLDMQLLTYGYIHQLGGYSKAREFSCQSDQYKDLDLYLDNVSDESFDADRLLPQYSKLITEREDDVYEQSLAYIIMNFAPIEYANRWCQEQYQVSYETSSDEDEYEASPIYDDFIICRNPISIPMQCQCGKYFALPEKTLCAECNGGY